MLGVGGTGELVVVVGALVFGGEEVVEASVVGATVVVGSEVRTTGTPVGAGVGGNALKVSLTLTLELMVNDSELMVKESEAVSSLVLVLVGTADSDSVALLVGTKDAVTVCAVTARIT